MSFEKLGSGIGWNWAEISQTPNSDQSIIQETERSRGVSSSVRNNKVTK